MDKDKINTYLRGILLKDIDIIAKDGTHVKVKRPYVLDFDAMPSGDIPLTRLSRYSTEALSACSMMLEDNWHKDFPGECGYDITIIRDTECDKLQGVKFQRDGEIIGHGHIALAIRSQYANEPLFDGHVVGDLTFSGMSWNEMDIQEALARQ